MKWINIKTRKPPKDNAFLAFLVGGQMDICSWVEKRNEFIDYYYHQKVDGIILFWMPLPEPPKN